MDNKDKIPTNFLDASNKVTLTFLQEPAKELRKTGANVEENPTLEIALLMDCTSSMSSWIQKAKETLNKIIDQIIVECKEEGNLKVRVCFVGYRDIKDRDRFTLMPFNDDINSVKQFISKTQAEGGADEPEDLQGGLKLALLQDWTDEASKRVFIISDAPCHGKKYHSCSDDYPNGSPDGLVLEDLMKEFCKKDIEFQFIKLQHNCDKMIEIMKECHQEVEVTDMTGQKNKPHYGASYSGSTGASYGASKSESTGASYKTSKEVGFKLFGGASYAASYAKSDLLEEACDELADGCAFDGADDYGCAFAGAADDEDLMDELDAMEADDGACDMMMAESYMAPAMMMAPSAKAAPSDDLYFLEAVKCTVNQVKKKQAAAKLKEDEEDELAAMMAL